MRPFVLLAANVVLGSVGFWIAGFTGGCLIAATLVADCMVLVAQGRAWKREGAAAEVYDWQREKAL